MSRTTRALISVADKTGVENIAKSLIKLGFEVLSTGGTAAAAIKLINQLDANLIAASFLIELTFPRRVII